MTDHYVCGCIKDRNVLQLCDAHRDLIEHGDLLGKSKPIKLVCRRCGSDVLIGKTWCTECEARGRR